jgi:hypothetical protein
MRAAKRVSSVPEQLGRRMAYRFCVTLPVSIELDGQKFSARLLNLARTGALIETSQTLPANRAIVVHCGTVAAPAIATWAKGNRFGVTFVCPLTEAQFKEQLARSAPLAFMRPRY